MDGTADDRTPDTGHATGAGPALSAREAAAALGVNERTIRRAIAHGVLPAAKRAGVYRIAPLDLARYRAPRPPPGPPAVRPRGAPPRLIPFPGREDLPVPAPSRPLTSLVGRGRELAAVCALLRRDDARLVTLIGPAGVGKTRLALEVASQAASEFPDGVWFVGLTPIADPALVLPTIARTLGVLEAGDQSLRDRLIAFLRPRQLLLALDNFEHVLDAAPLVAELLGACRHLKVLTTSRARLRVSGEREFPVPPLGLPNPGRLPPIEALMTEVEAVRLFAERAQAVRPGFAVTAENAPAVAEICRRLDGLPLAIELATARIGHLPPASMLDRLENRLPLLTGGARDQPARLRTMRDAVAWSHDLLSPREQALFRRLSVFVGGFTLEAAEAVGPAEGDLGIDVFDGISSLVDKSLVLLLEQVDSEPRYAMLETIREYGWERLAASGEEATVRQRHAAWCLAFAEQFWSAIIRGPVRAELLCRVETNHDNLRAALIWLEQAGDSEAMLQLSGTLWPFWLFRGHLGEGRRWLERALASGGAAPPALRARALRGAGLLARPLGDDEWAMARLEESLALTRDMQDRWESALSLHMLAIVVLGQGDYARAKALWDEALPLFQACDDNQAWVALAHHHLGLVAYGEGALAEAATLIEEAAVLHREMADPRGMASSLTALGLVACDCGDEARAVGAYTESLPLWEGIGMMEGLAGWLASVATLMAARRQPAQAARLFGAAAALCEALGVSFHLPERATYERAVAAVRGELGEATFTRAWEEGRALAVEQAIGEARSVMTGSEDSRRRSAISAPATGHGLTPREREVLRRLTEGRTDREIADVLYISPRTVQSHVANLFRKLGVGTRAEAAAYAVRHGLA